MKAVLRVGTMLGAVLMAAAPTAALAQVATMPAPSPPTSNSASPDTVGPTELQNFNLRGTVTRPAEQAPVPAPATRAAPAQSPSQTSLPVRAPQARTAQRAAPPAPPPASIAPPGTTTSAPAPAPQTVAAPPVQIAPVLAGPTSTPVSVPPSPTGALEPSRPLNFGLWPWIAAALALALGAGFLLWRRWPRETAAAGPMFDLLVPAAPEIEPQPQPLPRAQAPAAPAQPPRNQPAAPAGIVTSRLRPAAPSGIVASRLRPALELGFHPIRCQVDDDQVAIEFELELFNAGTAPARAVLAEASLMNAGATQEHELSAFFSNPNGVGERLAVIPPMKRVSFKSQVVAPRAAVQEYELAGRRAFVPVIAFNALYEWSGGSAQSSAAYLVGRDTQQEKLGPLRLDQGAREYRELGARSLPSAVRT